MITTNTKYHFRGRRTYYPGLNKLCLSSPPYKEEEREKAQSTTPAPSESQLEVAKLKRQLAALVAAAESVSTCKQQ